MIINSIFLPVTKSAGGLTFAKWKGKNTARARIFSNDSSTPPQIFQRARFRWVIFLMTLIGKDIIKLLWQVYEKNTTYTNECAKYNVPLQPNYVSKKIPFEAYAPNFKLGKGSLEQVALSGDQTYEQSTGIVTVNWSNIITGNGRATDKVVVVIADGEKLISKSDLTKTRADTTTTINMSIGSSGASMTVFISAYADDISGKRTVANGDAKDVTVI